MSVHYVTYADLHRDVLELDRKLPRDIAGVIGVARSGMLPATLLALHRNIALGSVCRLAMTGAPFDQGDRARDRSLNGRVLVLDDSCYQGTALERAKQRLIDGQQGWRDYLYAAVYGSPVTRPERAPDVVARVVPGKRYFAWNLFHHADLANAMLDMDGVLCLDPPVFDDGRGGPYERWLPEAVPFNIPSVPIAAVCTNRLQIWRTETEDWLARFGIRYGELNMSPYSSPEERKAGPEFGHFKGVTYRDSDCELFIESDDAQARMIAFVSNKPVIALDTGRVY